MLHVPTPALCQALQPTAHGIEGIANGDVHVLVRVVLATTLTHDDLPLRHGDVDADSVGVALLLMVMRRLDHDAAAGDVLEHLLELVHLAPKDRKITRLNS